MLSQITARMSKSWQPKEKAQNRAKMCLRQAKGWRGKGKCNQAFFTISPSFFISLIVGCALFMESIDETIIVTSLPIIALDFGENPLALKLALTAYFVSLGVFIPISGWIADRFGAKYVFCTAILIFMVGSILCGVSSSLVYLVVARFLQGIGGAMMIPISRLIIFRSVPKTELIRAWSYLIIPALIGPIIGPPLGGLITTYLNWRFIFFINVPLSLLAIAFATRCIKDIDKPTQAISFDFVGFTLLAPGLSFLMFGLTTAGQHFVSSQLSFAVLSFGALLTGIYCMYAKRAAHPLLNLSLLRVHTFRIGVLSAVLLRTGLGALPFLLPLLLQLGCGMDPFHSGIVMCTAAIGALFMNTLVPRILKRFGFRMVLTINAILIAVSIAAIAGFNEHTSYAVMMAILLISGCCRSLQHASLNSISYAEIESGQASAATSLESVAKKLSLGFGVTVGAFILEVPSFLQGHHTIAMQNFEQAFIIISLITLSSLFYLIKLPKGAGDTIVCR